MKETEAPEILKDLGPLNGLAGDARFLPVQGKKPYGGGGDATNWNRNPAKWLTAPQIFESRALGKYPSIGLMTGSRVGGYCWLDFDGKKVDERTGEIICGKHTLNELTNYQLTQEDLLKHYKSPVNISGKKDRMRILYRIPAKYADELSSKSYDQGKLEIIYEATERGQRHGVIEGKHPDGKEDGQQLYYRWLEGYTPDDLEVADLPEPVIEGWLKSIRENTKEEKPANNGPTFFDYLSPGEQKKLLYEMMEYWPYRDAHGSVYPKLKRLVLSLWRGIGDKEIFEQWLVGSPWDLKSDWDGTKYNREGNRVNGGCLVSFAESLVSSKSEDKVDKWGAAWSLAEENGWKLPNWAKHCLPPKILAEGLLEKSAKLSVELREAITAIEQSEVSPSQRLLAMQNLRKELKINKQDFTQLISTLQVELDGNKERSTTFAESMANRIKTEAIIPRLLAKGSVTLLAADGGVGKTAFINKMAESLTTGRDFAGGFKIPEPCPILLVQKDESESDAQDKWDAQGLVPNGKLWHMMWDFNPGMFPELRQKIEKNDVKVVFMDSFGTLFGESGTSMNDAEMGLYVYMLNRLASELNIAIVITHHLKKDQSRQRAGQAPAPRNVTKNDLYGSAYLVNGASSVWGMWKEQTNGFGPEEEDDAPTLILKVLKNRNGINETGEKFTFLGNKEDMSFEFVSMNGGTHTLTELDKLQNQMLKILSTKLEPVTAVSLDELRGLLAGSFSQAAIRKEAKTLVKNAATTGIARVKGSAKKGGGNPGWRYYRPKI